MFGNNSSHNYDDIIELPRHVSKTRKAMSIHDRAAQFSAFAALTGYEDAVKETARLTSSRQNICSDIHEELDNKLSMIMSVPVSERSQVSLTYFVPDEKKSGGSYVNVTGIIKKIDNYDRTIIMSDGVVINIDCVTDITDNTLH